MDILLDFIDRHKGVDIAFEEMMGDFLAELSNERYRELRQQDAGFDALVKKQAEDSERAMQLRISLPEDDSLFLEDYEAGNRALSSEQCKFNYLQGMRDCVKLMRYFGVIG